MSVIKNSEAAASNVQTKFSSIQSKVNEKDITNAWVSNIAAVASALETIKTEKKQISSFKANVENDATNLYAISTNLSDADIKTANELKSDIQPSIYLKSKNN